MPSKNNIIQGAGVQLRIFSSLLEKISAVIEYENAAMMLDGKDLSFLRDEKAKAEKAALVARFEHFSSIMQHSLEKGSLEDKEMISKIIPALAAFRRNMELNNALLMLHMRPRFNLVDAIMRGIGELGGTSQETTMGTP